MRRLIFTLLFSLIFSSFNLTPSVADEVSYDCSLGGYFTILDTVTVTGSSSCSGIVDIPEGVTSISGSGFYNQSITAVTIPNSVTFIGNSAFALNNSLTAVTIPDSVLTIDAYAFGDNTALTSVIIGDSVTAIGLQAFIRNTSLTSLTIGKSVETISVGAFYENTALTTVTIPNSVFLIGDNAFRNTALASVTLGNSVTTIGEGAFSKTHLTAVTIPNSVTTIGDNAFYTDTVTSLASVIIGDSVTAIGNGAFYGNTALNSLRFLGSAPSIGGSAFSLLPDSATAYVSSGATGFEDGDDGNPDGKWYGLIVSRGDAPAFTLSSTSEVKTVNNPISGYTIDTSTGGAIASYSISPSAPPGLTFDTSTGLLAGTPTQVAAATTYTITATNSWGSATRTFTLTVNEVASSGGGGGGGGGVVIDMESIQALLAAQEKAAAEKLAAEKAAAEKLAAEKAAAEKLAAEKAEIGIEIGIQSTVSNIFQPRVARLGSNQVSAPQVKLLIGNSISPTLRGLGKKELVTVSLSKDGRRFSLGNLKTSSRGELKLPPITLFKTGTYLVRITSADTKTRFLKVLVTAKKN